MKKVMTILGILGIGFTHAQTGKVGVNIETPTEILDVNGTAKVRELPISGSKKTIYNGNDTKTNDYTATRTVVADPNGVLGYVDGLPTRIEIPEFTQASKCISGVFQNRPEVNRRSEFTVGNIMLRYDTPNNAGGATARVEVKLVPGQGSDKISAFLTGTVADRKFVTINDREWISLTGLNYDAEGNVTGMLILHNRGELYRYSAVGWKETSDITTAGFCHMADRVSVWDKQKIPR